MIRKVVLVLVCSGFIFAEGTKGFEDFNITKNTESIIILEQNGKKFTLGKKLLSQYTELIKMVLATDSMDSDERQYWLDIMPSMTEKQIERLYNILDTERKKLQWLEMKYQEEIKELNEKHLIEWSEFKRKESLRGEKSTQKNEYDIILDKL